jgi:uncharacterized protein (DUF433 family)
MRGKPCIHARRVTVGMAPGQIAAGHGVEGILRTYPYLEREDIMQALAYGARRSEAYEIGLQRA